MSNLDDIGFYQPDSERIYRIVLFYFLSHFSLKKQNSVENRQQVRFTCYYCIKISSVSNQIIGCKNRYCNVYIFFRVYLPYFS